MDDSSQKIEFERIGPLRRLLKAVLVNPLANYMPAGVTKTLLRLSKSELAAANWADPGGWRSMVISYKREARQIADKILVANSTISMALRNRRRLASKILVDLMAQCNGQPSPCVLCLGAGPGHIIMDALAKAPSNIRALLVDLSSDAFEYGRELAKQAGLSDRVQFIRGDVRDVKTMLAQPPSIVKMMGICEYLADEQIVSIAQAVVAVMPPGSPIVFNSISKAHGTDRFFRRVLGLHMNHRSPAQLTALMARAGFGDFDATPEPLGVYHVIVGRKQAAPDKGGRNAPHG